MKNYIPFYLFHASTGDKKNEQNMDKITEIISHRENGSPGGAEHSLRSECYREREREHHDIAATHQKGMKVYMSKPYLCKCN